MKFVSKSYVHYADTTVPYTIIWFSGFSSSLITLLNCFMQVTSYLCFIDILPTLFGTKALFPCLARDQHVIWYILWLHQTQHSSQIIVAQYSFKMTRFPAGDKWNSFIIVRVCDTTVSYPHMPYWFCPLLSYNFAEPFYKCYQRRMCHWSTSCPSWYTKHIFHVWYVRERRYLIYTMGI